MSESLKLGLLENSHAFLHEAAANAVAALEDTRSWQFAILHLAQSLELSLKALLHRVHPAFVYRDIDRQKEMLGTLQAFSRLESPTIGGIQFEPRERTRVQALVALRNRITHADFELRSEHAAAKFFEMFAFVADFQARHLGTEIDSVVPAQLFAQLLLAERARKELASRAEDRIAAEGIPDEYVWGCPDCGNMTFVAFESIDTCYTCRLQLEVVQCPHCHGEHFEHDLEDFSDHFEWACGEAGHAELHDDFGYREWKACAECKRRIVADIERQRDEKQRWDEMQEDFYRRSYPHQLYGF